MEGELLLQSHMSVGGSEDRVRAYNTDTAFPETALVAEAVDLARINMFR